MSKKGLSANGKAFSFNKKGLLLNKKGLPLNGKALSLNEKGLPLSEKGLSLNKKALRLNSGRGFPLSADCLEFASGRHEVAAYGTIVAMRFIEARYEGGLLKPETPLALT